MGDNKITTCVVFFLFCLLYSCTVEKEPESDGEKRQNNEFYTLLKFEDLYRIPLIEPLELISTGPGGGEWFIQFPYGEVKGKEQVSVLSATVVDSTVLFQSDIIYFRGEHDMRNHWFLIDVRNKSQEVYKTEDEFLQVLAKRGIKKPVLYEVDTLFTHFQRTRRLPYYKQ